MSHGRMYPEDFSSFLWPCRLLQCVIGLAPASHSSLHTSYNALVTLAVATCCTQSIIYMILHAHGHPLVEICYIVKFVLLYGVVMTTLVTNLVRGRKITTDIASRMCIIDRVLLKHPVTLYMKIYVTQLLAITVFLAIYATVFVVYIKHEHTTEYLNIVSVFVNWYCEFASIVSCYYVLLLMLTVWYRYKQLNKLLCFSIVNYESRVFTVTMTFEHLFQRNVAISRPQACSEHLVENAWQIQEMNLLRKVNFILSDVVDLVTSQFSLVVLLEVISDYTSGINFVYRILKSGTSGKDSLWKTIILLSWCSFDFFKFLSLVIAGNCITSESGKTMKNLRQLLLWGELDGHVLDEVRMFLQETSSSRVSFTLCDFITLDTRFLFAYFGTIATCFIVFLQFAV